MADGQQMRDFIWVGDVVDIMLWLLASPGVNGLFNVGTGNARSYQHLAEAVCRAAKCPGAGRVHRHARAPAAGYQSFTQATTDRLARRRLWRPVHRAGGRRPPLRRGLSETAGPLPLIPVLLFPQFDPVLVQLGPLAIRWYALAYIGSLLLGWRIMRRLVRAQPRRRHALCRPTIS